MLRQFEPFDEAVIIRELRELPRDERRALFWAMESYQNDSGLAYLVKNYGAGLMMIRDRSHGQGRCLFFKRESVVRPDGTKLERLTSLLVYKKESDEVPEAVLKTARQRMEKTKDG